MIYLFIMIYNTTTIHQSSRIQVIYKYIFMGTYGTDQYIYIYIYFVALHDIDILRNTYSNSIRVHDR